MSFSLSLPCNMPPANDIYTQPLDKLKGQVLNRLANELGVSIKGSKGIVNVPERKAIIRDYFETNPTLAKTPKYEALFAAAPTTTKTKATGKTSADKDREDQAAASGVQAPPTG